MALAEGPCAWRNSAGLAGRLHVEDEVDVALGVVAHVLRAVVADMGEAQLDEQAGQRLGIGAGELDELEAVEADADCRGAWLAPSMGGGSISARGPQMGHCAGGSGPLTPLP